MKITTRILAVAVLAVATTAATPAKDGPAADVAWTLDASHSVVGFSVKHFFTPVKGQFDDYEAVVSFDPANPEASTVEVKIAVASVNTNNEKRDTHLQTADFFDAETYPYITFKSTSVRAAGDDQYLITGDLTIKDVTREVELPVTLLGVTELDDEMSAMFGGIQTVASFQGGTTVNRNDFGVGTGSWAATLVVGGEVNIDLALEVNR
jgi:polyisoprenoid-binding protein YceI